jgi:hypothetical protein
MKYFTKVFLLFILSFTSYFAKSQNFYSNYIPLNDYCKADSGEFTIHFYNNNFVKNNEYFGPFTEGITYIGSILQPEVTWNLSKNFCLSAGWYLRHYYGQDGFEKSLPVIRANYNFKPWAQLIIGQLNGQLTHGYIEPIYNTDNYFIKSPEYGVQLLIDKKRLHTDLFMDWEKFLLPGEDHQEEIVGGLLSTYNFNNNPDKRGLSAHFQSIIHHFGGQVDISDNPLESRANVAIGLQYAILPKLKLLNRLIFSSYYIQSLELSQTNTIPFESGFGTQNTVTLENKWVKISTGWFHAEDYFAPMADHLFQSISQFGDGYFVKNRDLITSKLLISNEITKGVNLGIRYESYYDLQRKWNDFSYGINISVNADVFDRRVKGKKD